jgi:CheY-like chemotaxis protein
MDVERPHILVVDDGPDAADSTVVLLGLWGYDGEARYDGATALAAARTRRPSVVLVDLEMPGMDGFQFVARLRDLSGCERTPVVVVSGHTTQAHQAHAREVGIRHYLFKPADPGRLRALLRQLVTNPGEVLAPTPGRGTTCYPHRTRRVLLS